MEMETLIRWMDVVIGFVLSVMLGLVLAEVWLREMRSAHHCSCNHPECGGGCPDARTEADCPPWDRWA